jgi:HD-GYP domain-containing protein (c-di-GMP phosphodiesterase class II)
MSKKSVKVDDLKIGMFVELKTSWFSHDFLSNEFKIHNEHELEELKKLKLKYITVDFGKSDFDKPPPNPAPLYEQLPHSHIRPPLDPKFGEVPKKWDSEKLMTDDLRNVLGDQKIPAQEKSRAVYQHSRSMMEQLLEFPTADNIKASKEAIYDLSDMVLADDETASNLLKITSHDFYTYTHSVNVGITSILLSKELFKHSDAHDLRELAAGFFLHDLGKVKIDPGVLNKPGRLTDLEMQHVKTHPYQGYKILKDANALTEECAAIVMQHHEAIDGSGYPRRIRDKEIHLYGKICAIADVFDALTAERSYKKAMKPFEALKLMKEQMIDRFDHKLFTEFVKIF